MFWCSDVFFISNLSAQLSDELPEEVFVETVLMEGDKTRQLERLYLYDLYARGLMTLCQRKGSEREHIIDG